MIGIPTLNGLNFEHFPLKTSLSLFTLSGSHQRRFSYILGNVKLYESSGKAGGLPMILDGIVENVRRKINTSPDEFEENESITYA
jgi:hypothetical protein